MGNDHMHNAQKAVGSGLREKSVTIQKMVDALKY